MGDGETPHEEHSQLQARNKTRSSGKRRVKRGYYEDGERNAEERKDGGSPTLSYFGFIDCFSFFK